MARYRKWYNPQLYVQRTCPETSSQCNWDIHTENQGFNLNLAKHVKENPGRGCSQEVKNNVVIGHLDLLGISSIANLLTAVKTAKYFELGADDVLFTVATDSMEMYGSRLEEENAEHGDLTAARAEAVHERYLLGAAIDHVLELSYWDRKRLHNLKYFTWVEQQGKTVEELNAQWDDDDYWTSRLGVWREWDERITAFNERTGLLQRYR